MVTYYPHRVASRDSFEAEIDAHRADDGLGTRVLNQLRQTLCGMFGHDSLMQFERDRMFLRCASCGHESPGWVIGETPPTIKRRGDDRCPAPSPQLAGVRRIA